MIETQQETIKSRPLTDVEKTTIKGYINTLEHLKELDIMQEHFEQNAIETLYYALIIELYKDEPLKYFERLVERSKESKGQLVDTRSDN